jgi:hypothetical protein
MKFQQSTCAIHNIHHQPRNSKNIRMADRRGEEIRFIVGTYEGHKGWIDNSGDATTLSVPVIVHKFKRKDGSTVDKAATVRKSSVRSAAIRPAMSHAEAIMQQHPKIDQMMNKLCRQLAKCEMSTSDTSIQTVFATKLKAAVEKQVALGADAEWKRVHFTPPHVFGGDEDLQMLSVKHCIYLFVITVVQPTLLSWFQMTSPPASAILHHKPIP